jgi:hypothetical protein
MTHSARPYDELVTEDEAALEERRRLLLQANDGSYLGSIVIWSAIGGILAAAAVIAWLLWGWHGA